jgi:hypothetical protein
MGFLGLLPRAAFAADSADAADRAGRQKPDTPEHWPKVATTELQLRGDGITFHHQTGFVFVGGPAPGLRLGRYGLRFSPAFAPLCTAPCAASLPAGTNTFAISENGGPPLGFRTVSLPPGNAKLTAHVESRQAERTAGVILLVASIAGGAALVATSEHERKTCFAPNSCQTRMDLDSTRMLLGIGVMGVGGLGGLFLMLMHDVPSLEVVAGRPAPPPVAVHGVALGGRF